MSRISSMLCRHQMLVVFAIAAIAMLVRPALALADDDCSGSFHIGDFFFGCNNDEGGGIGAGGIIAIIIAIIDAVLAIIGLSRASTGTG